MEKNKEKIDLALLWWLHESEQLKEKLSRKDVDKINEYVRQRKKEDPHAELWEIEYEK